MTNVYDDDERENDDDDDNKKKEGEEVQGGYILIPWRRKKTNAEHEKSWLSGSPKINILSHILTF